MNVRDPRRRRRRLCVWERGTAIWYIKKMLKYLEMCLEFLFGLQFKALSFV
jgi:hypothetical protein